MMITPCEYIGYLKGLHREWVSKRVRGNWDNLFYLPGAFDTEFTSMYIRTKDGKEVKSAVMYAWMFGLGEPDSPVCLGRTWEEWVQFTEQLQKELHLGSQNRMLIYVHNLPVEFQFMRKWFTWDKVFILSSHKPVYAVTNGLEFRCSLKLSGGRSLETVGKGLHDNRFRKLKGDLDYSLLRLPCTPLTEKERGYCENDIRVLLAYIKEKVQQDGSLFKIPLTNTGYVRQHIRDKCLGTQSYRKIMKGLTLTPEIYTICHEAFRGGDTHANPHFVEVFDANGIRRPNPYLSKDGSVTNVSSHDLTSSYPSVMVLEKFPMGPPTHTQEVRHQKEVFQLMEHNKVMFRMRCFGIAAKRKYHHPLPFSRCRHVINDTQDNGRIVTADYLETTMTGEDLEVMMRYYDMEPEIFDVVYWPAKYLPTPFVKAVLEIYKDKTVLKGVAGQEIEYLISKNMLNSAFGMAVTNIVRDIFAYDGDWVPKQVPDLEEEIAKYNRKPRRFLYYPWGVYITAYARRNLYTAIDALEGDFIYCDTDSVKYLNYEKHKQYFDNYNNAILEKIRRSSAYHRIPVEMYSPVSSKGKSYPIGVWEYEGMYERFKTLGAKRYLVKVTEEEFRSLKKDFPTLAGPYLLTCAGLNKLNGSNELIQSGDPFGNFNMNLSISPGKSGRLVHTYLDYVVQARLTDYLGAQYDVYEKSAMHLEPAPYQMHEMGRFVEYLRNMPLEGDTIL